MSPKNDKIKLSRRNFLKITGGTSASIVGASTVASSTKSLLPTTRDE